MNEPDVIAVLTEAATQLTDRGNRAFDDAAVLEQKGGTASEVTVLREQALVDLEASRRIRGLEPPVRRQGRRGPKPGASNGASPAPSAVSNAVPAPPLVTNKWGG